MCPNNLLEVDIYVVCNLLLSNSVAMDNFAVLHAAHDYIYAEGKFLEVGLPSRRGNASLMWPDVAKVPSAEGRPAPAPGGDVRESACVSKAHPTEFVFKFLPFLIHLEKNHCGFNSWTY